MMGFMNYTLLGEKINNQIQEYIDIVVIEITKEISGVKSIILGGGFGRGEGSVEVINGKAEPLNDFDMFVITEKKVPEKILNEIANRAISKIKISRHTSTNFYEFNREIAANTFYIDLKLLTIKELSKLPPMIRYYELKNAGQTIYGKSYLDLIPDYQVQDLPPAEGFRLLLNRMALLNLYFSMDFTKRPMTKNERYGLVFLTSKAYLGCCEALLQLSGKFVPYYLKRSEILKGTYAEDFPRLYKTLPNLPKKVEEAVNYRLKADFNKSVDPFVFWTEAKEYIWEVTCYFVKNYFDKEINSFEDLSDFIYSNFWRYYYPPYLSVFIKNHFGIKTKATIVSFFLQRYMNSLVYLRFFKYKGLNYPKIFLNRRGFDLTLYSAMIRILYSVDKIGKINKQMLLDGKKTLEKAYPVKFKKGDDIDLWNAVNDAFSDAYANFSFLKII